MVTVILQHEVENYDKWKAAFDADHANRAAAGMKAHTVGRLAGTPDTAVVISQWEKAEDFQKLLQNPNLAEAMKAGGVIGKPVVQVVEATEAATY